MNSGLPSLLEAIFGKQDLDNISLDEICELISEFPSFNAGHFLLSKKLKEQQESGYEKETMRTALYFNNPFWLESVLNEGTTPNYRQPLNSYDITEPAVNSSAQSDFTANAESLEKEYDDAADLHHPVIGESVGEENDYIETPVQEKPVPEFSDNPVKSFDDLISKYHIESLTNSPDSHQSNNDEPLINGKQEIELQEPEPVQSDDKTESHIDSFTRPPHEQSEIVSDEYVIREEVVNEYGIFEEVKIKKNDFDLEDFDRPTVNFAGQRSDSIKPEEEETAHPVVQEEPPKIEGKNEPQDGNGNDLHSSPEEIVAQQRHDDYEAFDRPIDPTSKETDWSLEFNSEEESISEIYSGQDQRLESVETPHWTSDREDKEITLAPEQQEPLKSQFAEFDQKKAESIVFTPYHMIDYFASQGIKLNLEDNPKDSFGRQLKSFTDWLKVMKKLPANTISGNTDEKEVDRIRHFAAHSIDEREILTESMAEVLAKQGMYESAIALFQKLSLIYPPKSAYFASRIEQIKASLP
jgi:hypothetical protein